MAADTKEHRPGQITSTPHPARLVRFLPAAAFVATFGPFFIDKNREARTVFQSGRGLLAVAIIGLGYLGIALVLRRLVRRPWLPPIVLAATILGLAAWIVRPYYVDDTANRELVTGPVVDASATTLPKPAPEPVPDSAPPPAAVEEPAQGPVRLGTGSLRGIDHDATGSVSLLAAPDGSLVVRFENFDIQGTPDPQVYLVPGDDVRSPGGFALGRMPGNRGQSLDMAVPNGSDAGAGWTVLVWCGSFEVPIANASLAPA